MQLAAVARRPRLLAGAELLGLTRLLHLADDGGQEEQEQSLHDFGPFVGVPRSRCRGSSGPL